MFYMKYWSEGVKKSGNSKLSGNEFLVSLMLIEISIYAYEPIPNGN